jgi:bisphosphoglycerate-dependent phosphoglycerate mutase
MEEFSNKPNDNELVSNDMETGAENTLENEPKGRNVFLIVEVIRHEKPGQTDKGMSADYLTKEGKDNATAKGPGIKAQAIGVYTSEKFRAQETGELVIENVNDGVKVINFELTERSKKSYSSLKPENKFIIRQRTELGEVKYLARIIPEAKAWAKEQVVAGGKGSETDFIIQYYLDHEDRCKELGITGPQEAAEETAYRIYHEIMMTPRLKSDSEVHLLNVTHGPKLEPFLQRILIMPDGELGFKSVQEIGGSMNPGEGPKFLSSTDNNKKQTVKLELRGQRYQLDLEKLKELADNYGRRQREKRDENQRQREGK